MAANEIIYLDHQPIQLYKVDPTAAELAEGQRKYSKTAYDQRRGECFFISPEYCHPVDLADALTFQFKAATTGSELIQQGFVQIVGGATDPGVPTPFLLEDSLATFVTSGVDSDYLVRNVATDNSSSVAIVIGETVLQLIDNIFPITGAVYRIYNILINVVGVDWKYSWTNNEFYINTPTTISNIQFTNVLTVNKWYKLTINVTDITAGSLSILFGTNVVATIDSVGTHIIYGQCIGNANFNIHSNAAFVGSISNDMNIYQLETDYTIAAYDLNDVFIDSFYWDGELNSALLIGNIFVNTMWNDLVTVCGNYKLAILMGNPKCTGQMITNGNFTEGGFGWTAVNNVGPTVFIGGGVALFVNSLFGVSLFNTLACTIKAGNSYTFQFDIGQMPPDKKDGTFYVNYPGGAITYDALLITGTQTHTFTAASNQNTIGFYILTPSYFTIDNVRLIDNTIIPIAEADGLSECLCVCSQTCTMLIKYGSDKPTFGEFYDIDMFLMYFRIPGGTLRNAIPSSLSFDPLNSTLNQMVQPYNKHQNDEELATLPMPQWSHDTLAAALLHPILYLDGVKYCGVGSYAPDWDDDSWLANVITKVAQTNQKNRENNY